MGSSTALTELTMQKYQRMQTCADVQRRSAWRPPYALTTALELLSIEVPRISSKHRGLATTTIVAVPHANDKRHIVGVKVVVWPFPLDTVIIEGQFTCTSPACTWAMFSTYLELEELIVLADSMMRRDRRLCRTTIDALSLYLDEAEAQVRADKENGTNSYLFRGYNKGSVRPRLTRKACSPKTRLFDCAERSNKRVEISLLQRQIDDSVQMCKQAFF